MTLAQRSVFFALAVPLLSCGGMATSTSNADDTSDAAPSAPDADASLADAGARPFPAFPLALPRVGFRGGPILKNPTVVPVFFAGDGEGKKQHLGDFLGKLHGSEYWRAVTQEYGVGLLSLGPSVELTEGAPAKTDSQSLADWVTAKISDGTLPSVAGDPIYVIYIPKATTLTYGPGTNCLDFGGYHDETMAGQAYAVIADCATYVLKPGGIATGQTLSGTDFLTGLTVHELIEAATDPNPNTNPAYQFVELPDAAWKLFLYGSELADACESQPASFFMDPSLGYVVQRSWSNASAKAGHGPCVPSDGVPYFGAIPKMDVRATSEGQAKAIPLALGGTATVQIALSSDAPTSGPWTVRALDVASEQGRSPQLRLSLDRTSGSNGDILTLTINVLAVDPVNHIEGFILESQLGGTKRRTAGMVVQP